MAQIVQVRSLISRRMRSALNDIDPSANTSHGSESKVNPAKETQTSGSLEFFETPTRYRRRPLTEEEIDLIKVRYLLYSIVYLIIDFCSRLVEHFETFAFNSSFRYISNKSMKIYSLVPFKLF